MKLAKLVLVISCLFSVAMLLGQSDLILSSGQEYSYKKDAYEKVNKMATSLEGDILAVGTTIGKNGKNSNGLFMKIAPETFKSKLWKSIGDNNSNEVFNSVIQNFDGTITIVGYKESKSKSEKVGMVLLLKPDGTVLNSKYFDKIGESAVLVDVGINEEGEVLAVGTSYTGRRRDVWTVPIIGGEIGEGKILNSNRGTLDNVHSVVGGEGNSFVLAGRTGEDNVSNESALWVFKINSGGRNLWTRPAYFNNEGIQKGFGITRSKVNGGYAVVGSSTSGIYGEEDIWMIKISETGKKEWDAYYGGTGKDEGKAIIELSEGGYAILAETKSHKTKASFSTIEIILTNNKGQKRDGKYQSIFNATEDNKAHSLIELFDGESFVLSGSSVSRKSEYRPLPFLGLFTYRLQAPGNSGFIDLTYDDIEGSGRSRLLSVTATKFFDANQNGTLDVNERGFFKLTLSNSSTKNLYRVKAAVTSTDHSPNLEYLKNISLGTLVAGQQKDIIIPILANGVLPETMDLSIDVETEGFKIFNSRANLSSYTPTPPKLVISSHSFSPAVNPKPGETIQLLLELTNIGQMTSPVVRANFNLPDYVKAQGDAYVKILGTTPNEKQMVSFYFTYTPEMRADNIKIDFSINPIGGLEAIEETFELRIDQTSLRTPERKQDEIYWVTPDPDNFNYGTVDVSEDQIELKVIALSSGELAKKNFSIRKNGKRAQGQKMGESNLSQPSKSAGRFRRTYSTTTRLEPGLNEIEIIYEDEFSGEVIAQSQPLLVNYIPKENPNLYVLSIGIQHDDLKYTTKDAEDFAKIYYGLKSNTKGKGFSKIDVKLLVDEDDTKLLNIRKEFQRLESWGVKDGDLVVIFLSTHGKVLKNGNYVLVPSDYDPIFPDVTSVDFKQDIIKPLRSLDGNKLVFVDACHSGIVGGRDMKDKAASKVVNDLIRSTSGMEIFASCSDEEYSYEDDNWTNGAFTKSIIEAFRNETVEINGKFVNADVFGDNEETFEKEMRSDGVITIEELKLYLEQRVPYIVRKVKGKPQHPTNKSDEHLDRNTGIFMVY